MKNCNEINELMSLYLDEQLDIHARERFEEHIKDCKECEKDLTEIKQMIYYCNDISDIELPDNFKHNLHIRLIMEKEKGQSKAKTILLHRRFVEIFSGIAALLLIALLFKGIIGSTYFLPKKSDSGQTGNSNAKMESVISQKDQEIMHDKGTLDEKPDNGAPVLKSYSLKAQEPSQNPDAAGGNGSRQKIEVHYAEPDIDTEIAYDKSFTSNRGKTSQEKEDFNNSDTFAGNDAKSKQAENKNQATVGPDDKNQVVVGSLGEQDKTSKSSDNVKDGNNDKVSLTFSSEISLTRVINRSSSVNIVSANPEEEVARIKAISENISYKSFEVNNRNNSSNPDIFNVKAENAHETVVNTKILNSQYQQFIDSLKAAYQNTGIKIDEMKVTDLTSRVNELNNELNEINKQINDIEKGKQSSDAAVLNDLKKKRDGIEKSIEELQTECNFVSINIFITK